MMPTYASNKRLSISLISLRRANRQRNWQHWMLLLLLSGLSACASSEAQSTRPKGSDRAIPVVSAKVSRQTVPLLVQTSGVVQAYSTISLKSQIDGQLIGVYFHEGQGVKKGDLLFRIDARPLQALLDQAVADRAKAIAQVSQAEAQLTQAQAQVNQAKATVAKDLAQAKNAEVQARRYTNLVKQGAVSREQAEQYITSANAQKATVTADISNVGNVQAAVESARANIQNAQAAVRAADSQVSSAKVQLSYAAIYAPNDGQLGKLNVNQGNLVKANDTNPLVTLSQVRPIYVEFSIPQRQLLELKKYQNQGQLSVAAKSPQDSGQPALGKLVFVDSGIDNTTGTINLKATFPNAGGQLTPGQFVNVTLKLSEQPNAIVVPTNAVQAGQKGAFVYAIAPNRTVEARQVTVGQTVGNQTVIKTGLQVGDRVVTDGQFNLTPGAKVREKGGSDT